MVLVASCILNSAVPMTVKLPIKDVKVSCAGKRAIPGYDGKVRETWPSNVIGTHRDNNHYEYLRKKRESENESN